MRAFLEIRLGWLVGLALAGIIHLLTAPRIVWRGRPPSSGRVQVYYANHTSNADTVLIWAALPPWLRAKTRPVAAADYWLKNGLRKFFGTRVFHTVLIQRDPDQRQDVDPVGQMSQALDGGASLIIFPEGRRNESDAPLLPFKTGLFHLASARREVDLVPVWIDNLNGVMPRGEVIPVPLICQLFFGEALHLGVGETRDAFLDRARAAMLDLRPEAEPENQGMLAEPESQGILAEPELPNKASETDA